MNSSEQIMAPPDSATEPGEAPPPAPVNNLRTEEGVANFYYILQ